MVLVNRCCRCTRPSCDVPVVRWGGSTTGNVLNAGSEGFGDLDWETGTAGPYGTPTYKAVADATGLPTQQVIDYSANSTTWSPAMPSRTGSESLDVLFRYTLESGELSNNQTFTIDFPTNTVNIDDAVEIQFVNNGTTTGHTFQFNSNYKASGACIFPFADLTSVDSGWTRTFGSGVDEQLCHNYSVSPTGTGAGPAVWQTKALRKELRNLPENWAEYTRHSLKDVVITGPHVTDPNNVGNVRVTFPRGFVEPFWEPAVQGPAGIAVRVSHIQLLSDGVALTDVEPLTGTGALWFHNGTGGPSNISHTFTGVSLARNETLSIDYWCQVSLDRNRTDLTTIGCGWAAGNAGYINPVSATYFQPTFTVEWFNSSTNFNPTQHTLQLNFIGHDTGTFSPPADPWTMSATGADEDGFFKSDCHVSWQTLSPVRAYDVYWGNEVAEIAITYGSDIAYYRPTGSDHLQAGTSSPLSSRPMGKLDLTTTTTFLPFGSNGGGYGSDRRNYSNTYYYITDWPTSIEVTRVSA